VEVGCKDHAAENSEDDEDAEVAGGEDCSAGDDDEDGISFWNFLQEETLNEKEGMEKNVEKAGVEDMENKENEKEKQMDVEESEKPEKEMDMEEREEPEKEKEKEEKEKRWMEVEEETAGRNGNQPV
jgi:hypothetical protein